MDLASRSAQRVPVPSRVRQMRLLLSFFSIIDAAAHLFASPGSTPIIAYRIDIEAASYGVIAVIYLLGLRQYYGPPIWFTSYNFIMFFLSGVISLPFGINAKPLVGHIQFFHYSFGRGFSLLAWVCLLTGGIWMLIHDPGSKLNQLLRDG